MDVILSVLLFLVVIGLLVTLHEFGHFLTARWLAIPVYQFSIGFGPALFRWEGRDGMEWRIGAIPLGGYVLMPDVPEPREEGAEQEPERAERKPYLARIAVAGAGPAVNLLVAVLFLAIPFMWGVEQGKPRIGYVEPDSPADQAGLAVGQELKTVDGVPVRSWGEAQQKLMQASIDRQDSARLTVRTGDNRSQSYTLPLPEGAGNQMKEWFLTEELGLYLYWPVAVEKVVDSSPAAAGGIGANERIVGVNGRRLESWPALLDMIPPHEDRPLELEVASKDGHRQVTVIPERVETDSGSLVWLGVIVAELPNSMMDEVRFGPLESLVEGARDTWALTGMMLGYLENLVLGKADSSGMGGPVTIADQARESAEEGGFSFLLYLGLVSLSLGLINLLPFPPLDGGQILFHGGEAIRGRPWGEGIRMVWNVVGLLFLATFMVWVLMVDWDRFMGG